MLTIAGAIWPGQRSMAKDAASPTWRGKWIGHNVIIFLVGLKTHIQYNIRIQFNLLQWYPHLIICNALVPKLIYVLKKFSILNISALKQLISNFRPNFKKCAERRWQWRLRWRWKIFNGEMLQKWNDIVPTYVEVTKKKFGQHSQC